MAADLAILGARIRTLDPARPSATAVAIADGVVIGVGDDAGVRAHVGPRTEVLDGRGQCVVPGLVDSHVHPIWGAELAVGVDLAGCTRLEDVRRALHREAREQPPHAWIRAWNADHRAFAGGIRGAELEEAVGGRPALVLFADLHSAVATPRALELAGVDGPRSFADASEIVLEAGRPTGELREPSAYRLVLAAAPGASRETLRARVTDVLRRLAACGLTGGHAMDGDPATLDLLADLEEHGTLSQRLVVPLWQHPGVDDDAVAAQLPLRDRRGRRWRGGVAKFFIDGVIESGTAWLYEPDTQGDGTAPFWPDPERFAAVVARFARAGFQCATHAIGDRAVGATLDAYRDAGATPANGAAHRIEHLELLTDGDLDRLVRSGVVASMQPVFMAARTAAGDDPWGRRVGPERRQRAFRVRDVLDRGGRATLGSDWPVSTVDPRVGMAWARLRRPPKDTDAPALEPQQRLTALQALHGYTTWPAATVGARRQGRIEVGCAGDLTAFAADPVDVDADDLVDLPVLLTVVDGEVVHRNLPREGGT